jgi:tripartite-type tricarboxylate transporter receptor subunit TctC
MKIQLWRRIPFATQAILFSSFLLLTGLSQAVVAAYPDKAIKVLVGYAPGSSTDIIGRIIAQDLSMA